MIKIFKQARRFFTVFKKRYNQREKLATLHKERYRLSKTVFSITSLFLLLMAAAYYALFTMSSGTYLSGWFLISAILIIILLTLSAPYSIVVTNKNIVLHGYIDVYQIPIDSIKSVEVLEKNKYKQYLPLFVSLGYLGFFGYYINLKQMEIYRVYASKYSNWLVVRTEDRGSYIFNVKSPSEFIELIDRIKDSEIENKIAGI